MTTILSRFSRVIILDTASVSSSVHYYRIKIQSINELSTEEQYHRIHTQILEEGNAQIAGIELAEDKYQKRFLSFIQHQDPNFVETVQHLQVLIAHPFLRRYGQ